MRVLIQRVKEAELFIDGQLYSKINQGYLLFLAFHKSDNEDLFAYFLKRIFNLKLFSDSSGIKMDRSLLDIQGEILLVSQFTLYGNAKKGNKVSWSDAMPSSEAKILYDKFLKDLQSKYFIDKIKTGVFGADMQVKLVNDGPVTLLLEKFK